MSVLPRELNELAASGAVLIVGSCDAAGVPELSRAWGVQFLQDALAICVPSGSGQRVLTNLEQTRRIAVTITSPTTYRSFQLKGQVTDISVATPDDCQRVAAHQYAFIEAVVAVGMSRETTPRLYQDAQPKCAALTRVRMQVETVFDQTPGPGAGARL